ncbi:energy-coupling factor transporter ATPase [Fructobacillus sp. M2-14]|uniref:Energy-coupling factor transporter ATPase n=1 Tax=Fructobacillus broussonetiae TaxID=2713173 RepID=A0ABS5R105_9LACO|nr:energy-coupling factor transporter ATPase [Fructobacillus broussonetiae]MBS9339041.1 energy-coupling factor transporter ATPase [Fructobacillus broussonetiae]
MTNAITIKNLTYSYPESGDLFKDFSMKVEEGEWLAIVGHNGSGKSTLAKLILGLLDFKEGDIHVFGTKLTEKTLTEVRSQIGMVFQNPDNQFVGATVADDVAFGLENRQMPSIEMPARIEQALKQVGMEDFADREPHTLSGGQKQRVALASVLALQPKVIILDEATAMLDPEGKQAVMSTLRELKEKHGSGLTLIMVTHDMEEAQEADRVAVIDDGELLYDEEPNALFQRGAELKKLGLAQPFAVEMSQALGVPAEETKNNIVELVNWLSQSKV